MQDGREPGGSGNAGSCSGDAGAGLTVGGTGRGGGMICCDQWRLQLTLGAVAQLSGHKTCWVQEEGTAPRAGDGGEAEP